MAVHSLDTKRVVAYTTGANIGVLAALTAAHPTYLLYSLFSTGLWQVVVTEGGGIISITPKHPPY